MKDARERALRRRVRGRIDERTRSAARLDEDFTPEERDQLSRIIRNEIADVFYDLFRRRSFWAS